MKLIVSIDKENYKRIKDDVYDTHDIHRAIISIRRGTPLPKGHGRLIDAKTYEQDIRKHYFDNSTVIRCTEIALDNASTIIEADKAESEVNNE